MSHSQHTNGAAGFALMDLPRRFQGLVERIPGMRGIYAGRPGPPGRSRAACGNS